MPADPLSHRASNSLSATGSKFFKTHASMSTVGWNMYSTGIGRGTERRKCHLRPLSLHVHTDSLHAHMRMQGGGQTERGTHTVPTFAL